MVAVAATPYHAPSLPAAAQLGGPFERIVRDLAAVEVAAAE